MRYLDLADALRARIAAGDVGAGRRAAERGRAGPGVRHQPGHRAPGARPAAPGGARHQPPGRGLVRRASIRCASRSGGSPRSKPRSRPPARTAGPRASSRSGSSTRPARVADRARTRRRRRGAARRARQPRRRRAVRARHRVGARRSRRRRVARRRRAGAVLRPACRCAASSSAPCTRRSPPRSPTRPTARCSHVEPGDPLLVVCRASRTTPTATPVLYSEHRYPADRTTFEIEFSLRRRSPATCLSQIGPTTPAALVEAAYAQFPERVAIARERLGRPLTFAEKVLVAHADDPADGRARTRRRLRRLPARPRRDAGRDRADGAAAVHARADCRRSRCRRPCTATT